jgi:hypothetical protein
MTPETLVCAEHVTPAQLSALRDGALAVNRAERLQAHVAGCAACRARLADYDRIPTALLSQRELEPRDRIIAGVRAQLADPLPTPSVTRWLMVHNVAGVMRRRAPLPAVAAVAALILLFVSVFSVLGHLGGDGVSTVKAPGATVTASGKSGPTATTRPPVYTAAQPAAQAWGVAFTPITRRSFHANGSVIFVPGAVTADLTTVSGELFDISQNGVGAQAERLANADLATGAITTLGPSWGSYGFPVGGALAIDDRYIVYGYNAQPGATCGVCHNTLWAYDRTTGATWQFDKNGDQLDMTSSDHVAYEPVYGQISVVDLAARTVKVALPSGAEPATATSQPGADERLLGFQWPYLLYTETPATTPSTTAMNILDLSTGKVTRIVSRANGQTVDPNAVSGMALIGTTLYVEVTASVSGTDAQGNPYNLTYNTLYQMRNALTPDGEFTSLATWPQSDTPSGTAMQASSRLLWLGSGYVWDTNQSRLILTPFTNVQFAGPYLVALNNLFISGQTQSFSVAVYDPAKFPTS